MNEYFKEWLNEHPYVITSVERITPFLMIVINTIRKYAFLVRTNSGDEQDNHRKHLVLAHDMLDYLLSNGAKVNVIASSGNCPLSVAGDALTVDKLIRYGADPCIRLRSSSVLLSYVSSWNMECIEALAKHPIDHQTLINIKSYTFGKPIDVYRVKCTEYAHDPRIEKYLVTGKWAEQQSSE